MSKSQAARRRRAAKVARRQKQSASLRRKHEESLSRGRQAARELDGLAFLRERLGELAEMRGEWAGIPMPTDHTRLIVEPSFPNAEGLMSIGEKLGPSPFEGYKIRNLWYSERKRCEIGIVERPDGSITWGYKQGFHHLDQLVTTIGCAEVWGLEQEQRALKLLGGMLRHHNFKQYILTGMFLEQSERSGIVYVFRRLRPTVAIKATLDGKHHRILAALCMHPIAYYADSWAGAMCPTDDVIAHLSLMRGDEHMFWKRCSQHQSHRPEAGI